jgi:methyl coenzyme M reductase subunit C-like uncharacterized protein (methanogenesis marker protein 7)
MEHIRFFNAIKQKLWVCLKVGEGPLTMKVDALKVRLQYMEYQEQLAVRLRDES